eukprot:12215252-Alexandrium_andersonii.AAC.1
MRVAPPPVEPELELREAVGVDHAKRVDHARLRLEQVVVPDQLLAVHHDEQLVAGVSNPSARVGPGTELAALLPVVEG